MADVSFELGSERLLKLAAFLRTVPNERFFYDMWVGDDWGGKQDLSCGTTACAFGWACTIPEFQQAGLYLERIPGFVEDEHRGRPRFEEFSYESAAAAFFGIDDDAARHLFIPAVGKWVEGRGYANDERKASPSYVADKIERFVASRKAETP